jgi:DNA polymerase III alpha subunit (gram-positive type)
MYMLGQQVKIAGFDTEFRHNRWNMMTANITQIAIVTDNSVMNRYINHSGQLCDSIYDINNYINSQKISHLVGHNVIGDARLLFYNAIKCNISIPRLTFYDTMDICHLDNINKSCKLIDLFHRYYPNVNKTPHNAIDDAQMSLMIFDIFKDDRHILFSFKN